MNNFLRDIDLSFVKQTQIPLICSPALGTFPVSLYWSLPLHTGKALSTTHYHGTLVVPFEHLIFIVSAS